MFRVPDDYPGVSQRLSKVLDDIGINARTVNVRRRTGLLSENIETLTYKALDQKISNYCFGSQTEGTTTLGLKSDTDSLSCSNYVNVIQEWSEWKRGRLNLLMLQDNTIPPGHCRLQLLRGDSPVARGDILNKDCEYDNNGRVLLKNTSLHRFKGNRVRNGPAETNQLLNGDIVAGFPCRSWPKQATQWILRCRLCQIQDITLIGHSIRSGCFVVPTGHCSSLNERLEWRISTSIAERYMMFSMNITQIRCYVLLKMIMKTFITPVCPDTISSYHCKTVLMYLVENSHTGLWNPENLLLCVTLCLTLLRICIITNKCPHYFIPENNLLEGRLGVRTRERLTRVLCDIICCDIRVLQGIDIDNIGDRLRCIYTPLLSNNHFLNSDKLRFCVHSCLYVKLLTEMLVDTTRFLGRHKVDMFTAISDVKNRLASLVKFYITGNDLEREAILLLTPSLCTTLGSLQASADLSRNQAVSDEALSFFSLGMNSDVASGRLKFASTLFCTGDMERTEMLLRDIEERYNPRVTEPIGARNSTVLGLEKVRCPVGVIGSNDLKKLRSYFAFEVMFSRNEIHCVPKSLRYEMFRCTEDERIRTNELTGFKMDWAVVDSLPYLYYLQYLVYGRLGRKRDQQRAVDKLDETCATEPRLFHRETALNLLGQCMEEEGSLTDALASYILSLTVRPTHNVARWHIAILLWKMLL